MAFRTPHCVNRWFHSKLRMPARVATWTHFFTSRQSKRYLPASPVTRNNCVGRFTPSVGGVNSGVRMVSSPCSAQSPRYRSQIGQKRFDHGSTRYQSHRASA